MYERNVFLTIRLQGRNEGVLDGVVLLNGMLIERRYRVLLTFELARPTTAWALYKAPRGLLVCGAEADHTDWRLRQEAMTASEA